MSSQRASNFRDLLGKYLEGNFPAARVVSELWKYATRGELPADRGCHLPCVEMYGWEWEQIKAFLGKQILSEADRVQELRNVVAGHSTDHLHPTTVLTLGCIGNWR